jgi:hypothetical protein
MWSRAGQQQVAHWAVVLGRRSSTLTRRVTPRGMRNTHNGPETGAVVLAGLGWAEMGWSKCS